MKLPLTAILATAVLSGCAATSSQELVQSEAPAAIPAEPARSAELIEKDREAIRAMAGEYIVSFAFDETVPLIEGYERKKPKRSGASEVVILIEDSPNKISLQTVALSDEQTKGQWTQCVYGVYDNPRYCGTGAWNHRYGNPTWTSDRNWRVLPRREFTTRDDYNAMNVENRHTITPAGWTHEQDNTKVVRSPEGNQVLVREFGFNEYRHMEGFDFQPAYDYWEATAPFWAKVRDLFDQAIKDGGVRIKVPLENMDAIEALFELAEQAEQGDNPSSSQIKQVFAEYIESVANEHRLAEKTR